MTTSLQSLRREAGYRSGRAAAAALGISESTYARYEADPAGVPLRAAWKIADHFGCTIDEVVGRVSYEPGSLRGAVQEAYDALPEGARAKADDYLAMLAALAAAPGREAAARDAGLARGMELAAGAEGEAAGREDVSELLCRSLARERERAVAVEYDSAAARLDDPAAAPIRAELEAELAAMRDESLAERAEEDEGVVERIMAAYDAARAQRP